jgi:Flp pilus assembly protein TadG
VIRRRAVLPLPVLFGKQRAARSREWVRDDGSSIVEMALSAALIFGALFGVIAIMLALYTYNFVSDAAREATRWASVRGSQCSTNNAGLDHCNAQQSDIQSYVQNLGYPGLNKNYLTITASWLSETMSGSPATATWSACSSPSTPPCNAPGNMVKVVATYAFPLGIPYWKNSTLNVSSTSEMVILD